VSGGGPFPTPSASIGPGRRWAVLLATGLVGGVFSGLFGVGGGVVIVPALVTLLRFPQRLASGTSLMALFPIGIVGAVSFGLQGTDALLIGVVVAAGAVVGGLVGGWLVVRVPNALLAWLFIAAVLAVVVQLFFFTPVRGTAPDLTWPLALALAGVGVVAGVLSGLIGIGGGIVINPALMLGLGMSDLVAKAASLIAIVPNALTTTIANALRRNVDLLAGAVIGATGAAATILGTVLAHALPPRAATIAYAVVMLLMAAQMTVRQLRHGRR